MFTFENNLLRKQSVIVQAKLVSVLLGKSVMDSYGRQVGFLLVYSMVQSGEVSSIGVDRGTEGFEEFGSDRFRFEKGSIVVTPKWKPECQGVSQNLGDVQGRLASLNQLARHMGIPRSRVDQLVKKTDRKTYAFLQS